MIPVETIKDTINTICDFSGSKKYTQGRLIPPANNAALTPIDALKSNE